MGNLMYTLETGKSTLLNTQVLIQTTAHNIANADSAGYARQKAIVQTNGAYSTRPGHIGMGAKIAQIIQNRDQFIERRLLESVSDESHYDALSSQLRTLGTYLLDDGALGLSDALGNFWNSWETLQKNPTGVAEREHVNQAAQRMTEVLNTGSSNLQRLVASVDSEMEMLVGKTGADAGLVEGLLSNVAVLNRQIRLTETPGRPANDLRDQRYQALQELSQYLPIEFTEEKNGLVTVRLSTREGSIPLVDGEKSAQIRYQNESLQVLPLNLNAETALEEDWVSADLKGVVGGRLSGLLAAREEMTSAQARLENFAQTFSKQTNGLLPEGVTPFFSQAETSNEWQFSREFWAHYDPASNSSAIKDLNELASKMVTLNTEPQSDLGGASFSDYLAELQRHLGVVHKNSEVNGEFHKTLKHELQKQQQSVSGVNLDEEMVDMLKNQQVYQAAAKIIQRTGELLQSVINMV